MCGWDLNHHPLAWCILRRTWSCPYGASVLDLKAHTHPTPGLNQTARHFALQKSTEKCLL
eukprot:1144894-Pelagomonas_calceolata.AAC.2